MQIKKNTVNKWKRYKSRGDGKALAELTGLDMATISRVLNGKQEVSFKVVKMINDFFEVRKKELKAIA